MRLLTWNCCKGPSAKKLALLVHFQANIAVIQECPRPAEESERCLWFGDNPKQGILVKAGRGYALRGLPVMADVPKFLVPVGVSGPGGDFTLFAVWAKKDPGYPYVEGVVRAIELYREQFAAGPCVLMGDLNSSAIWDREHPVGANHSALVAQLSTLGLVSVYHEFFGEEQGRETRPTYYFHWNEGKPFHIDYCFLPAEWSTRVADVHVGGDGEWKAASDHRPMVVDLKLGGSN